MEIHPVYLANQVGLHPKVLSHRRLGPPPLSYEVCRDLLKATGLGIPLQVLIGEGPDEQS